MPSGALMMDAQEAARDFTHHLKTATASNHRQLEQCRLSTALMLPSVTLHIYQAYLTALLPVWQYTETHVFPTATAIIKDLNKRSKATLLANDLLTTGLSAPKTKIFAYFPEGDSADMIAALAHLYVLEGSTLGGKIIGRHIFKYLGLDSTTGASYFNCYGDFTGNMWKSFLEPFASYAIQHQVEEQIIGAANQVFTLLLKHFEKVWIDEF